MKYKIKFLATVITLLILSNLSIGKEITISYGSIKGQIVDSNTKLPVSYATVAILDNEGQIVTGVLSDDKGDFVIKKVTYGEYNLSIQFIGYTKYTKGFTLDQPSLNFGQITLSEDAQQLDEVVVKGEKLNIVREIDKNIININEDLANGNTVSDILNTIPEINIGSQGEISLRGDGNVRVMIDGKISQIDPSQLLQTLPATSIERIEVITNPSSKYSPDGLSGIINVITKKNKLEGLNGGLYTDIGSKQKTNNYLGLNYRIKKFNFFLDGNYGDNRLEVQDDLKRDFLSNNIESFTQNGSKITNPIYKRLKAGTDFFLDSTNTITFYYERTEFDYTETNIYQTNSSIVDGNLSNNNSINSFDLNHIKEFKKGTLETDLFYEFGIVSFSTTTLDQDYPNNENYNNIQGDWTKGTFKTDYTQKLNDFSSFEIGLVSDQLGIYSNIDQKKFEDADLMNITYDYKEIINSAYASYSVKFGDLSIKAGLRGEIANIEGRIIENNEIYYIDYKSLFPSLHLKHQLNDHNNFGLSYSRRISRPSNLNLLPIEMQLNTTNIQKGNPNLRPSYTNSLNLEHGYYKNSFNLNTSVYVRYSTNDMRPVAYYDADRELTVNTYDNFGSSLTTGLSISSNLSIFKWWKVDAGVNLYHLNVTDVREENIIPESEKLQINWSGKLNTKFTLPKDISISIYGRYNGYQYDVQTINEPNYAMSVSIQKGIFERRGNITFKLDDIVNNGYRKTVYGDGFQDEIYFLTERPIYRLSLNYNFGSQFKGRKNRKLHTKGGLK